MSIRVLVSGAPGLTREIVIQAVASQPDMALVDAPDDVALGSFRQIGDADVIVVLLAADGVSVDAVLGNTFGGCAVVAVADSAQSAWSYEYELRRVAAIVNELSPQVLLGAIRTAAQRIALRKLTSLGPRADL